MLEISRLGVNDERDSLFDCGNDDLNEFFRNDSKLFCSELIAVTYVWKQDNKLVAFFSVSNDAIARSMTRSGYERAATNLDEHKHFSTLPAVKIGRLGVDKKFQQNGVGSSILNFIKGWFISGNKTGCRFVLVDALNNGKTTDFYSKNGFIFLSTNDENSKTRIMFFDLIVFKEAQGLSV